MTSTGSGHRQSRGSRRAGYAIAIVLNAAFLVLLNMWPGWQAMSFLSTAAEQVLWLVNLSAAAGIAANVGYLAFDPPWLKTLGDLVTTGLGLVTAIRVWQVFPFVLSAGWSTAVRVLLVIAITGSCLAVVAQIVSLAVRLAHRRPPAGHLRTGH